MAISETARLIASLELKDLFSKQVDSASKSLGKLDKSLDSSQSRAYKAGTQIGTGIKRGAAIAVAGIGLLATQVALGIKSLDGLEKVTTQTDAVLKSTHDVSKQTSAGIRDMANEFENLNATIDDTVIQSGANVLLTFTNIREKAFKPTIQAALDMNQALGGGESGLQGTIQRIGRALNDPIKGLGQLTRVGVTFTAEEKKKIAELVKSNNLYGAQTVILDKLNTKFGGSFLAGGGTTAGKIAKVKDAIDDLQRALATALLPALGKVADATSKFLTRPEVVAGVAKLGQQIAGLFSDENLAQGAKVLEGLFQTVKDLAPIVEASAKSTLTLVQAAVGLFKSLPPEIQSLAVGAFAINKLTGGLVTNIGGALIDLIGKSRGASPANPVFVSDVTKGIGVPGVAGAAENALPAAAGVAGIGAIVTAAAPFVAVVAAAAIADYLGPKAGQAISLGKPQGFVSPKGGHATDPLYVRPVGAAGLPNPILDRGGRETGQQFGKLKDDVVSLANLQRSSLQFLHQQFREAFAQLSGAKTAKQIKDAILAVNKAIFGKGIGGSGGAAATEKTLRGILSKTDDPKLRAALSAEIRKVHDKVLGRQFEEAEFRKFDKVWKSSEGNAKKIAELQKIAKDVGAKDRANGQRLQAKVDALKAGLTHAISQDTQAIKDKDLSVRVTIPVSNRVVVNARTVQSQAAIFTRVFGGQQTRKNPGGGIGF